uniref:DNA/RNA-binding protein Alba-like domain-containing protein n=2 Tax=Oryza TaxID=4527 RepID=A0A0E0GID4_ORYNI
MQPNKRKSTGQVRAGPDNQTRPIRTSNKTRPEKLTSTMQRDARRGGRRSMEESALEITTAASGQPRDSLLLHHRPYMASTRSLSPSPLLSDRSFPSLSLSLNLDRKAASESDTMQAVREEEEQVVEEVVRAGAVAEEEEGPEEKEVAMVGEEMAEAEHDEEEAEAGASAKKNRIQVSTNKKPLYFYVNLAKSYMQNYDEVELSALGMAIGTVVTVAEILKNNGLATEKKILTSTIGTKDESKGRLVRKAKIEILLCKSENFNTIMSSKKSDRPKSAEEEIKV